MTMTPSWLLPDLKAGLDKFIADRDVPPEPRLSEAGALQIIVRDWLQAQGYVPLPGGDGVVPLTDTDSLSSAPLPLDRSAENDR